MTWRERHKGRIGKVLIGAYFDAWVQNELRLISAQEGVPIQDLIGEGIASVLIARVGSDAG